MYGSSEWIVGNIKCNVWEFDSYWWVSITQWLKFWFKPHFWPSVWEQKQTKLSHSHTNHIHFHFQWEKTYFSNESKKKKKRGLKWRSLFSQRSLLQWTLSLTWLLAGCRCQPQCVTVHTPHLSLSVTECGGWARRRFGFTVKPITHKVMGSRHVRPVTDKFIRLFSASESRRKNEKVSLQVC